MASIAVTSANVRALTSHGAVVIPGTAGATVTNGYLVYSAADGDWEHADANADGLEGVMGVCVETFDGEDTVAAGNALSVCIKGPVSGFTGLTAGAIYYLSNTVGRLEDAAGAFNRPVGRGVELAGEVVLWVDITLTDAASS